MKIAVVLCALLCAMTAFTQTPTQQQVTANKDGEKQPEVLELNTMLMRSTYKLFGEGSTGTAFLLGRPNTDNPKKGRLLLITASHVLEKCSAAEMTLVLRIKSQDGYLRFPYSVRIRNGTKPLWTKHPEADVAVMYLSLPSQADIALLPISFLATDEALSELQVHPGESLSCLGFPNGAEANDAGFPILRSGRIASYPILPTRAVKSFLFDMNVFDGNSGGPVYLAENMRMLAPRSIRVGGAQIVIGLVSEQIFASNDQSRQARPKEPLRLAVVIHASLILDTINRIPVPMD